MSKQSPEIRLVVCGKFSGLTPPPKFQLLAIDRIRDPATHKDFPEFIISFRPMPCWIFADSPEEALAAGKAEFPAFKYRLAVAPIYGAHRNVES